MIIQKEQLKPFDKVLVKNATGFWVADFFSHYIKGSAFPFCCMISERRYQFCIPYEGNEHLLGAEEK